MKCYFSLLRDLFDLKFNKTNEQLLLYSDDNFFSTNVSYLTLNNPRGSNLSLRSNEEFRSGRAEYLVLIRAAIILSVRMSLFRIHDKFMKYGEKNECRDGFNKWFKTYAQNLTNAMDPINDQPVDIKSVRFTTYNSKKPRGQRIQVITRHLDMMYFQCCIDNARHTYDKLGMSFNSQFFAIDSITQLINQWVTHSDMEEFMKIYAHLFSILSALDRAIVLARLPQAASSSRSRGPLRSRLTPRIFRGPSAGRLQSTPQIPQRNGRCPCRRSLRHSSLRDE